MAALNKSAASLRIVGDSLKPDEVSRLLGSEPSLAYSKGEIHQFKAGSVVRKSGMWSLDATDRQPGDLDAQIAELFDRLTDDLTIWVKLAATFKIDIFCGFFMLGTDEGMTVSPETMKILSDRGIQLALCFYGPLEEKEL